MPEFRPGVPTAMFTKLSAEMLLRGGIALTELADGLKKQAKINASTGRHQLGTPTPSPGNPVGPAIISRTLVGSIDRTQVIRDLRGYVCSVGTAAGKTPPYHHVPSSQYGLALELQGVRRGRKTFPFLYPAFNFAVNHLATVIYTQKYGAKWARVI